MIRVKTLTVQLIDAQPDRIRICRIDGESLVTVVIPREDLAERSRYRTSRSAASTTCSTRTTATAEKRGRRGRAQEIFGDSGGIAELADDLEFPTPSAAAVFVLGGNQNGWTEWVSDDGETLNQVYRSEEN